MNDAAATDVDVLVVGSGAGAMTAAIRAQDKGLAVLVIEKSDRYGGTSALSGGGIWIPCNSQIAGLGGQDSLDDARRYMHAAIGPDLSVDRVEAYLNTAPEMVDWMAANSELRFHALPHYPDYYPHLPGHRAGYRTMEPAFFRGERLGDAFDQLREPAVGTQLLGRISMGQAEAGVLFTRARGWLRLTLRMLAAYWMDVPSRLRGKRDRRLTMGQAMVAALRRTMLDRSIPLELETALESLIVEDGRVAGARVRTARGLRDIRAAKGVILAAGGFERNQAMREKYLPHPTSASWSATPPHNTGDAIRAGEAAGGALALMDRVWGSPTSPVPGHDKQWGVLAERGSPGSLVVNGRGMRFTNEAEPYLEFVEAMYADHAAGNGNLPAWMVFDGRFRKKYAAGPLLPTSILPDKRIPADWLGTTYQKADTLDELAAKIGVDAAGLRDSVARMNAYAVTGEDLDFGRGGNVFDRYYADPNVRPNPCLAAIDTAPFYALRLDGGDIGTKGGLVTDAFARVLDEKGAPIAGLYAIGNCSAAVMGRAYPGPGSTLGPAMTFGYVAGKHVAGD